MANEILKGIKVVELGTYVAVPYCSRELADMGADVIKVEPPKGEDYRMRMGRNFQLPNSAKSDWTYTPYNVNKKNLCLDLKKPEAAKAMEELISGADIFITNTREEVLARLGLDFDTLRKKFPKLICASVSGFGDKGPMKDNRGYDLTSFWSPSGMIQEWNFQGNLPFKPFYGFGDAITASQMTAGILAALYRRAMTGEGDVVRTSLMGTGLWTNVCGLLRYQAGHHFPKPFTEPIVPMDNLYETKDGKWICISEANWGNRCQHYFEFFGTMELMDDPNWNNIMGYISNIPEKVEYFRENFKKHTKDEIVDFFTPRGIIVSVLMETDDIIANPQAWANDFLRDMHTQSGEKLTIANIPLRFESQGLIDEIVAARQLGEDTVEILKGLGYSEEAIGGMIESGAAVQYKE